MNFPFCADSITLAVLTSPVPVSVAIGNDMKLSVMSVSVVVVTL